MIGIELLPSLTRNHRDLLRGLGLGKGDRGCHFPQMDRFEVMNRRQSAPKELARSDRGARRDDRPQ